MADKAKTLHRDAALVNILGRMAEQLQKQDQMLEDVARRQIELSKTVESNDFQQDARQTQADVAIGKLQDSFSRYRSDMLSLVNEQDTINRNISSLNSLINSTIYSLEKVNQAFSGLDEHVRTQEKSVHDHFAHSLKQAEIFPKLVSDSNHIITKLHMDTEKNLGKMHQESQQQLADSNRSVAKLHMDSEKNLGKMHQETLQQLADSNRNVAKLHMDSEKNLEKMQQSTQRQLEKLQQETTRRLLVLDDMESALETLLIRTEPPEKKPFWFIRLFRRVRVFSQTKLSRLLKIRHSWKR